MYPITPLSGKKQCNPCLPREIDKVTSEAYFTGEIRRAPLNSQSDE